ncbi:hypothetical protein BT67DRAFT_439129 [Trichocladium antarcticum]|uniref:Uncharacterized protein n=1 Tax=Trichocladium antarcticum TaxID=1450529 RepID=A0AAN6UU60_9PEZI|nr:hypothetical protein BT67DRAFT_439129 [Trichocladium antarcticum]
MAGYLGVAGWAALPGARCGRVARSWELGVAGRVGRVAGSWAALPGAGCSRVALLGARYGRVKVGYCDKTTYVERAIVGIASKN